MGQNRLIDSIFYEFYVLQEKATIGGEKVSLFAFYKIRKYFHKIRKFHVLPPFFVYF